VVITVRDVRSADVSADLQNFSDLWTDSRSISLTMLWMQTGTDPIPWRVF